MNMRRRSWFVVHRSSFGLALLFLACAGEQPGTTSDDLGRKVALPPHVARVVTLAPNLTEMVFAVGAGAKIAGTDDASNFPLEARAIAKVGGMQPNIEKIVALRPDLVLASTEGNPPNLAGALEAAGIPLFVIRTDRLEQIPAAMRRLGRILGAPQAEEAARKLERSVEAQRRRRARAPRVMFVVWTDPLYVAGRNTFTDDLFVLTGAVNAVSLGGWPQYSLEALLASPPEILLYPRGAVTPEHIEALLARLPGLRTRAIAVDADIFQRPGPRMGDAAGALNAILDLTPLP